MTFTGNNQRLKWAGAISFKAKHYSATETFLTEIVILILDVMS